MPKIGEQVILLKELLDKIPEIDCFQFSRCNSKFNITSFTKVKHFHLQNNLCTCLYICSLLFLTFLATSRVFETRGLESPRNVDPSNDFNLFHPVHATINRIRP